MKAGVEFGHFVSQKCVFLISLASCSGISIEHPFPAPMPRGLVVAVTFYAIMFHELLCEVPSRPGYKFC